MKIAICLTGFLRMAHRGGTQWLYEYCYDKHDVDLYVATWNVMSASLRLEDQVNTPVDELYIKRLYGNHVRGIWIGNLEQYNQTRKAFVYNQRPNDVFKNDGRAMQHVAAGWPDRMLDQWYVVQKSYQLIPKPSEYDVIMRCRSDIGLHNTIEFECAVPSIHIPTYEYLPGYKMEDKFAWGSPDLMKVYMNTYDDIQKMYDEDNVDVSFSEHMLYESLVRRHKVPVCTHSNFNFGNYWHAGALVPHAERKFLETHTNGDMIKNGLHTIMTYPKSSEWTPHFHKIGTEECLLSKGLARSRGQLIIPGTVITIRPYEILDLEFLEDSEIYTIRTPKDEKDEYIV